MEYWNWIGWYYLIALVLKKEKKFHQSIGYCSISNKNIKNWNNVITWSKTDISWRWIKKKFDFLTGIKNFIRWSRFKSLHTHTKQFFFQSMKSFIPKIRIYQTEASNKKNPKKKIFLEKICCVVSFKFENVLNRILKFSFPVAFWWRSS